MRWLLLSLCAVVTLVLVTRCQNRAEEADRVLSESIRSSTECSRVWEVGTVLSDYYTGCIQESGGFASRPEIAEPLRFDCPAGSGSEEYVSRGRDYGLFATEGGLVRHVEQESDADGIKDEDALAQVCQPPLPDCFTQWKRGRSLPEPYRGCSTQDLFDRPVTFPCPAGTRSPRYVVYAYYAAVDGGPVSRQRNPATSKRLVDPAAVRRVCNSMPEGSTYPP